MMRKIYTCNICRDEIKDLSNLIGFNFKGLKLFSLDTAKSTEGAHACKSCIRQIVDKISSDEWKGFLNSDKESS